MKKLIIPSLILLFIGASSLSYSFWDSLQSKNDVNISIGNATTLLVNVTENVPIDKTLVPNDVLKGVNDITSINLKYSVKLDKEPEISPTLNVVAENINIGGETTYSDIVLISITKPDTVSTNAVEVLVTVTLKNQANGITEEIYNAINSKSITFNLTFTAIA